MEAGADRMKKPVKDYEVQYPQDAKCNFYSACETGNTGVGPCGPGVPAPFPHQGGQNPSGSSWGK